MAYPRHGGGAVGCGLGGGGLGGCGNGGSYGEGGGSGGSMGGGGEGGEVAVRMRSISTPMI